MSKFGGLEVSRVFGVVSPTSFGSSRSRFNQHSVQEDTSRLVPLNTRGSLDQPPTSMHRSLMNDSINYYDADAPINFVHKLQKVDQRGETAILAQRYLDGQLQFQQQSSQGKTAQRKRRDIDKIDSLLEMTVTTDRSIKILTDESTKYQNSQRMMGKTLDSIFTERQGFCQTAQPKSKHQSA
jgi:hypothetical protein